MITLASPVKPAPAAQQFGYAQAPQAFQHNPQGALNMILCMQLPSELAQCIAYCGN